MKSKGLFLLIFALVMGITIYSGLSKNNLSSHSSLEVRAEVGFQAPGFELEELSTGDLFRLETSEKPKLINFWASWCGPCRMEAPDLVELHKKYEEELEIYAINITNTDRINDVKRFVETYSLPFPVLIDQDGSVTDAYQVIAIPTTYLVDTNGMITAKHQGFATMDELEKYVKEVLN